MPIKPENKARYPKNWKEIRANILVRAGHACEGSPKFPDCRVPNYALKNCRTGEITEDGQIAEVWELADGDKVTKIVLTIGHLDHVPENCDPENLKAWCQRCHLNYDLDHHRKNSAETRRKRLNNTELFEVTA